MLTLIINLQILKPSKMFNPSLIINLLLTQGQYIYIYKQLDTKSITFVC